MSEEADAATYYIDGWQFVCHAGRADLPFKETPGREALEAVTICLMVRRSGEAKVGLGTDREAAKAACVTGTS